MQDVVRVIALLELLEAIKRFSTERRADALDGLISLHIVDISTPAVRPGLNRRRTFTRPGDLFSVEGRVLPDCQHTDVERGLAEAHRSGRRVGVFRRSMQRLDHDPSRRTPQRVNTAE